MDREKVCVTDEWLYNYMPIVDEAIISELERNTDYEYRFTGRFERRMKRLLRREAHPRRAAFWELSKKAAVLFFCAAGLVFFLSPSVEADRRKLFETVRSVWEDSVLYSYFAVHRQEIFQRRVPGYIPGGYRETERMVTEHWFSVTYTNEEGKVIAWDQMLVQDGGELTVDREFDRQVTKEIDGMFVTVSIYRDGSVNAYCEDEGYVFFLTADDLSIEEVGLMFDGLAED